MPGPNEVLPCGTESARRRHAAHGQTCRTCDRHAPNDTSLGRLLADNHRFAVRLAEVDAAFTALLQVPVIRHEAVDRAHRRLFPTSRKEAAA